MMKERAYRFCFRNGKEKSARAVYAINVLDACTKFRMQYPNNEIIFVEDIATASFFYGKGPKRDSRIIPIKTNSYQGALLEQQMRREEKDDNVPEGQHP
jgi:hypothetical protein